MQKFVDDSTLSEIIGKDGVSQMETYFGEVYIDLVSTKSGEHFSITKTKEMSVGANVKPSPQLIISGEIIERVFVCKLLGVLIDTNLKWDNHAY